MTPKQKRTSASAPPNQMEQGRGWAIECGSHFIAHNRQNMHCISSLLEENGELYLVVTHPGYKQLQDFKLNHQ